MDLHAYFTFFTHIPFDWIVLGVVFVLAMLASLKTGPAHAIAISLALTLALYLVSFVPQTAYLGGIAKQFSTPATSLALFAILFVTLLLILNRMTGAFFASNGNFFGAALAGLGLTIVLAVVWNTLPQASSFWHFGTGIAALFGATYRFWWLIGAYIALAIARET